ncbi:MAG: SEC-C domain-containing protein [Thiobacillus sp.]|nr:SEC-C domain-containing protein [Thiobacillus sp.]
MNAQACPCGSGHALEACCGRYHAGESAPDAERLMRSRYSAFVLGLDAYLLATWHPDTRPTALELETMPPTQWQGLTVKSHQTMDASHATVEFVARYKLNGRAYKLHEVSRFEQVDGRWFYVDGEIREGG